MLYLELSRTDSPSMLLKKELNMNAITLTNSNPSNQTMVPNIFIDKFMPSANGSYVKVYLYLLRSLTNHTHELSITFLADCLDNTEKDIMRALNYWEKCHILSIDRNKDDEITNITFHPLIDSPDHDSTDTPSPVSKEMAAASIEESIQNLQPTLTEQKYPRPTYSINQIQTLCNHDDLKWLLNIIPIYLDRTLKSTDIQLILYIYETLGFSAELIAHLYDYCVSKNKKNINYIEAVALSWAEEGIDSIEKAQISSTKYNSTYNTVNKAFGLNRMPGSAEKKFIDKWVKDFAFDDIIIAEACNRSLLQTSKPDFKYANRILENWHKNGVKHLSDIQTLDQLHNAKNNVQENVAKVNTPPINTGNKFSAFPQRNYTKDDYSNLEQKLLNKQ